jgi:cell division protein FtsB
LREESLRASPAFRKKVFILGIACLFLVMVVTSVFGKIGVMDIHRARLKLADLDLEVQQLKQEKSRLEAEIRDLEKNPKAVEKEARGELWLIKPGEKVIVIPKDPKK